MKIYQEALNYIVKNSCPSKTYCSDCSGEKTCNCLAKNKIDILQELIGKQEKYKWHDLIKNPNDLPKNSSKVFACLLMDYGKKYYECFYHKDKFKIEFSNRIIGWKYIEEFEGE